MNMNQLSEYFSEEELDSSIKVLQTLHSNQGIRRHIGQNEKLKSLFSLIQRLSPVSKEDKKLIHHEKKRQKKEHDMQMIQDTGIRRLRAQPLPIAAPPVFATLTELESEFAHEVINIDSTKMLTDQADASFSQNQSKKDPADTSYRKLHYQRSCHICSAKFHDLHFFYDQLCPACAEFNYEKRSYSADMKGRVCVVTGARVKIGYFVALKLLRMGATVIATTRFPHDAAQRYASESDFKTFANRLFIHGIDFRDIKMVHHFCNYVRSHFDRLDVLINNAAQTVRKPPQFYEHLIEGESKPLSEEILKETHVMGVFRNGNHYVSHSLSHEAENLAESSPESSDRMKLIRFSDKVESGPLASLHDVHSSAALSQLALLPEDQERNQSLFPQGQLDPHLQQLDLRRENSWVLEIGQISTMEMLECHVINAFAPWVLISELKPLMDKTTHLPYSTSNAGCDSCDKYIVNVSAMEGQFYRVKTAYHPHTNMAKASLNMLTRTAAQSMAESNIFMTAVDTGWITDENPVHEWDKRQHNPPPLDECDAAMRILDPVLKGIRGEEKLWGVFLKNYKTTRW